MPPSFASQDPVALLDVKVGQCRFIVREHPAMYCGVRISSLGSWCDRHRGVVFQKPPTRPDKYAAR